MKIGYDAKRALNNGTGLGNHARILLNGLMLYFPDNEYLLFTPKARDEFFNRLQGPFKLFFPTSKFHQALHPLWRSIGIKNNLLQQRVQLYHGLSNEIPFGLPSTGIASVVTLHDLIFLKHKAQYPWADRQIYTLKTRYAAKHANHVIAVSHETKTDLIERYGVPENKISVIYPAVDTEFEDYSTPVNEVEVRNRYGLPAKYILNVGSFFPRKNQEMIVRAFARIKNEVAENLVLVGSTGFTQAAIEKLIAKEGLQQRVKILNHVSNADLPALYRLSSAFVFPSLYEGFGAPVLEALLSKTPVIATGYGAIAEAAGSGSLFVKPTSAEDIADKLLLVLNNALLRHEVIQKGLAHAQTMTNKAFAEQTMQVYKNTLQ